MKRNLWVVPVQLGILMICAAAGLCAYNLREGQQAGEKAETVAEALRRQIPEPETANSPAPPVTAPPADDLYAHYETTQAETQQPEDIVIDGDAYCGILEIPVLGIELPIRNGWSYPALKQSPCCSSGSAETNDMIIAAHNYPSHFGRIGSLNAGDVIRFTDTRGTVHEYAVSFLEIIAGTDVTQMHSGQSVDRDLTIYTCLLGGQGRVTVRAVAVSPMD